MKKLRLQTKNARIVVQGFGNVGRNVALIAAREYGMKIVAVADQYGAVVNSKGLDVEALARHVDSVGRVPGFAGGDAIDPAAMLELECDVLVPAAIENQITIMNAERIKARIVDEAANGPTTPEADAILQRRGILVLPDILTNAGGVTVSYFEWVQDLQSFFWSEEQVNEQLQKIMVRAFHRVWDMATEQQCDLRTAAQMIGIRTVAEATERRGLYP
jgi:glutamate dehydrogenase (NAD(P)+)